MNKDLVIQATNIKKSYFSAKGIYTSVLSQLDLNIVKGKMTAIMGPSGVGKSTLLHLLGSLDKPEGGTIRLFDGKKEIEYNRISRDELALVRNKRIGFVFQFSHLLPEFSALENVMIPALIANESKSKAEKKALELLRMVEVEHRAKHKPKELSGGEQQRIAIARAIINQPVLVLADEPTGNLDSKNANAVLKLLNTLKAEQNMTIVIATHSKEIADLADRILIMGNGKIVSDTKNN
jgi:lipoprotein-releasing system ATP-binding protein